MGRGRFLWEVAVAVLLVTVILCSNKCEAAIAMGRGSSYGGNMVLELMMVGSRVDIFPMLPRFLDFVGAEPTTDQCENENAIACDNGAGNPNGACGGSSSNKKDCDKYANNGPC